MLKIRMLPPSFANLRFAELGIDITNIIIMKNIQKGATFVSSPKEKYIKLRI